MEDVVLAAIYMIFKICKLLVIDDLHLLQGHDGHSISCVKKEERIYKHLFINTVAMWMYQHSQEPPNVNQEAVSLYIRGSSFFLFKVSYIICSV